MTVSKEIKAVQQGITKTDPKELREAKKLQSLEVEWHQNSYRYKTDQEIAEAAKKGELSKVTPSKNYRPIFRLINPELHSTYPPYLNKKALKVLNKLTKKWKKTIKKIARDADKIYIPVTSLTRSQAYQQALVESGKFAFIDSTHCTGYTFDFDASSYYYKEGEEIKSVRDPRRYKENATNSFSNIRKNIRNIASDDGSKFQTEVSDSVEYNKKITDALVDVVEAYRAKYTDINYIIEFDGTPNRVVHVCVKP